MIVSVPITISALVLVLALDRAQRVVMAMVMAITIIIITVIVTIVAGMGKLMDHRDLSLRFSFLQPVRFFAILALQGIIAINVLITILIFLHAFVMFLSSWNQISEKNGSLLLLYNFIFYFSLRFVLVLWTVGFFL